MLLIDELIRDADNLFGLKPNENPKLSTYVYTLGRYPYGWVFNVINSWHNWSSAGYQHQFGAYQFPESAIQAFLQYVKENNINVMELMNND